LKFPEGSRSSLLLFLVDKVDDGVNLSLEDDDEPFIPTLLNNDEFRPTLNMLHQQNCAESRMMIKISG
jgi:hypothetical protein